MISMLLLLLKTMISSYYLVVPMFLGRADRIPAIIQHMQEHTNPGGYNLIVHCHWIQKIILVRCPSRLPLKKENWRWYKDWELVKYNENPGHLHRRDENGNRISTSICKPCWQRKKKEKAGC